jgi:hypothetical protein
MFSWQLGWRRVLLLQWQNLVYCNMWCRSGWAGAWTVFARSNTAVTGSNPIRGIDIRMSVCVYSVFVLSCVGSGLATGWSPVKGVLPTMYRITILKNWPGPNIGLCSHWWMNERYNDYTQHNLKTKKKHKSGSDRCVYTCPIPKHLTWAIQTQKWKGYGKKKVSLPLLCSHEKCFGLKALTEARICCIFTNDFTKYNHITTAVTLAGRLWKGATLLTKPVFAAVMHGGASPLAT